MYIFSTSRMPYN